MATKTLFDRAAKTITATGQMRYKNAYKRRLMDKCIMGDIINKVPSFNTGHNAGAMNRCFDIGGVTDGQAVVLYKTQKQCDDATGVQHRDVAADFMVKMANVLQDGEGLSGNHVSLIVNSPLKHLIQT